MFGSKMRGCHFLSMDSLFPSHLKGKQVSDEGICILGTLAFFLSLSSYAWTEFQVKIFHTSIDLYALRRCFHAIRCLICVTFTTPSSFTDLSFYKYISAHINNVMFYKSFLKLIHFGEVFLLKGSQCPQCKHAMHTQCGTKHKWFTKCDVFTGGGAQ